jgi:hypothetical protein
MKGFQSLKQQSDYQLLKKDSSVWSPVTPVNVNGLYGLRVITLSEAKDISFLRAYPGSKQAKTAFPHRVMRKAAVRTAVTGYRSRTW